MALAIILAEASPSVTETFMGLSVTSWLLLLTTVGGGVAAFLKWLEARATKRENFRLELAKINAEAERDAVIAGVEIGGDHVTKAAIRKTAIERGVASLADSVKKATGKFDKPASLILACVLLSSLWGCCAVDHDRMAATAAERHGILGDALALPDSELFPVARAVIQSDRDYVEAQYSELTGAPITSAVRARAGE